MVSSSLILRTQAICGNSRSRMLKWPRVMRSMAAMAWTSGLRAEGSGWTTEAVEEEVGSGVQRGGRHAVEQLRGDTQHKGVH